MDSLAHERGLEESSRLPESMLDSGARDGMIPRPELKIGRRHYLRLYAANVAANSDRVGRPIVYRRIVAQMVTAQPEGGNLFRPN